MIKEAKSPRLFDKIVTGRPFFGVCMQASYLLYKSHSTIASFYTIDNTAALSVTGHSALLCGNVKSEEELNSFLNFCGITQIKTDGYIPHGFKANEIALMLYKGGAIPPLGYPAVLDTAPDLQEVSALVCKGGIGISADNFYSDGCMRRVRGLAQVLAIKENGVICATAGVYAISRQEAYIAAVYTAKAFEKRGYASYLVAALAQTHKAKRVILICEDNMRGFYERLGFSVEKMLVSAQKN